MRGYAEQLERLEYLTGRTPTDREVLEAMADDYAARLDAANEYERDAAAWGRDYAHTREY